MTNAHSKEQSRIARYQTAFRILGLLVQYQQRTERGGFSDGLEWTPDAIGAHLRLTRRELPTALAWLLRRGYIEHRGAEWFFTPIGKEVYEEESRSVRLNTGAAVQRFRVEALTGMDEEGNQSEIDAAALPSPGFEELGHVNRQEDAAVELCDQAQRLQEVARRLGMLPGQVVDGMASGRVQRCKGIQELVAPHWGVFDRHGGKGRQWQALCKECRKLARKR